jgi:putative membrane protein
MVSSHACAKAGERQSCRSPRHPSDSGRSALLLGFRGVHDRVAPIPEERAMYYGHDGSGTAWWWMLPMMFVFLVTVVAVVWALFNTNRAHASQGPASLAPEEVLAHRLARGEIDTAEYHERLEALRKPR